MPFVDYGRGCYISHMNPCDDISADAGRCSKRSVRGEFDGGGGEQRSRRHSVAKPG